MSKITHIKISEKLHSFFINRKEVRPFCEECFAVPDESDCDGYCEDARAPMYLVGRNKKNICVDAVLLVNTGNGCHCMPQINKSAVARAAIELYKSNLVPTCFVLVNIQISEHNWDWDSGDAIFENLGIPFVSYLNDNTIVEIVQKNNNAEYNSCTSDIENLELKVVRSKYKLKLIK
jgi:hypothetical protein